MKYVLFFATQNGEDAVFELLDSNADLFYIHYNKTTREPDTVYGICGFVDHDYERACIDMMASAVVVVRM